MMLALVGYNVVEMHIITFWNADYEPGFDATFISYPREYYGIKSTIQEIVDPRCSFVAYRYHDVWQAVYKPLFENVMFGKFGLFEYVKTCYDTGEYDCEKEEAFLTLLETDDMLQHNDRTTIKGCDCWAWSCADFYKEGIVLCDCDETPFTPYIARNNIWLQCSSCGEAYQIYRHQTQMLCQNECCKMGIINPVAKNISVNEWLAKLKEALENAKDGDEIDAEFWLDR